jgi:predicted GNAT family N-acyltransferase
VSVIRVSFVGSQEEMAEALRIRRLVFIDEQRVPEDLELDEHDDERAWGRTAVHALLWKDGLPAATGRLLLEDGPGHNAHVGRVAVLREYRGTGLGRALMEALQERAHKLGYPRITHAAQLHAIPFYERLGYVARGAVFLDAGIEHRWMDLEFGPVT